MAKHGGYPGGMIPGNYSNLMKQAQRMQRQMEEQQAALEQKEFTASAGGAVTVVVTGKHELKSVKIQPDVVDPEDVEMLEDLIMAAVNEALHQVESAQGENLDKLTGGMSGLGLNGLF